MEKYLGIDWGGTYIKAGVVDAAGRVIAKEVFASRELRKKNVFVSEIQSLLSSFSSFKIKAVGIGAPGIVDIEKGFIYYLPNVPGWKNYPLKQVLTNKLSLPIYIGNDADVFALAEFQLGAGREFSRGIFLTLGTGLGGAVVLNGKILEGKTSACELGHIPISLDGKKCACGGRGCIETFVGIKHLLERYKQLSNGRVYVKEVKDIYRRALDGEKPALAVWQEFSLNLGRFLAGMVNLFNPQVIVFGGGVSGAFSLFRPQVAAAIKKQAMWPQVKGLKLARAKLKDAGIIGAAFLAKEKEDGIAA